MAFSTVVAKVDETVSAMVVAWADRMDILMVAKWVGPLVLLKVL